MPITQTMTFTATPPTTGETPTTFNYNAIACWNELKTNVVPDLNVAFGEMNTLETNVNAKEVSANYSADIATAAANFQGEWTSKGYTLGQSVSSGGTTYMCKLTHVTGFAVTNTTYWQPTGLVVLNSVIPDRKNYIINGGFDYWNYATSQTTSGYGSDDRWINMNVGSTKTHSMVNATDTERALFNSSKFSRTVVTSVAGTGNQVYKTQLIENITKLAGKTVTVSFWAKADAPKSIAISQAQIYGSGGTPSATTTTHVSKFALTSTWTKFSYTYNIPSLIGKTLGTDGVHTSCNALSFWFDSGSGSSVYSASLGQQSGTFDIAEVKLEEGSVATPWTPYEGEFGGEIQACQRYYKLLGRLFGLAVSSTAMQCFANVGAMRIESPTVLVTNATPSGESPVSVTERTSTSISPFFNWYSNGTAHITFNNFSGLTPQQTALVNPCVALSAEL